MKNPTTHHIFPALHTSQARQKGFPHMTATIDPLLVLPAPRQSTAPRARSATPRPRATASRRHSGPSRPVAIRPVASRPSEAVFRRRRRTVGLILAVAAALCAFVLIGPGAVATESTPAREQAPRTVIAQRGDTIWDIARTLVPTGPIGDLVTELIRLNGTRLEPGQVIRLP